MRKRTIFLFALLLLFTCTALTAVAQTAKPRPTLDSKILGIFGEYEISLHSYDAANGSSITVELYVEPTETRFDRVSKCFVNYEYPDIGMLKAQPVVRPIGLSVKPGPKGERYIFLPTERQLPLDDKGPDGVLILQTAEKLGSIAEGKREAKFEEAELKHLIEALVRTCKQYER